MIWKLLRRNISGWQTAGYAVATLVGMVIVMAAVQFYFDLGRALTPGGSDDIQLIGPRNIVISKSVGLGSTLSGVTPSFSEDEVEELASRPWAGEVVPFRAADFRVWGSVEMAGRGMTSALFFESIPDNMVDSDIEDFSFDPDDPVIPIVISKDYLALYNFGFAASGGMPVVSEGLISRIPLEVTLSGNGRRGTYPARIVGFSSWLNTIAVPQSFMDWAHGIYGNGSASEPSRLIVELTDPGAEGIEEFMESRGYEIAGNGDDLGKASRMLKLISSIIAGVGAVITLLALFILILSLFLLVQKNRRIITGLLLLGYTPGEISLRYIVPVVVVNAVVWLLSGCCVLAVARLWYPAVEALGAQPALPWAAFGAGFLLAAVITVVNIIIIRRLVKKCFRG